MSKENLEELKQMFKSSMGYKGKHKMLVTSASQVRVTRTSQRLVQFLIGNVEDPCVESVLHLIKSQQSMDFGLTLGLLTCDLILQKKMSKNVINQVQSILHSHKLKLDVNNLDHLLAFLTCSLKTSNSKFPIKLVEAFLQSLPDDGHNFDLDNYFLELLVEHGASDSIYIRNGFLYPTPEIMAENELRWSKYGTSLHKMIILNLQLKADNL